MRNAALYALAEFVLADLTHCDRATTPLPCTAEARAALGLEAQRDGHHRFVKQAYVGGYGC